VGATVVHSLPDFIFGEEIEAGDAPQRADIKLAGRGAGGDAFDVFELLARGHIPRRNTLDEFVSPVTIEDQDSDSAIFNIIANSGDGNVEKMSLSRGGALMGRFVPRQRTKKD